MSIKVVDVEWNDCAWSSSVYSLEETKALQTVTMHTVGYLVLDSPDRVVVCGEKCGANYRHIYAIPRA